MASPGVPVWGNLVYNVGKLTEAVTNTYSGGDYMPNVHLQNGAMVFDDDQMPRMAIAPAVSMDWPMKA